MILILIYKKEIFISKDQNFFRFEFKLARIFLNLVF